VEITSRRHIRIRCVFRSFERQSNLSLHSGKTVILTPPVLQGNYIEVDIIGSRAMHLKYFPASALPIDPAARFSELFLTRSKWKAEEIAPFLSDIALNNKERDKLLLKYCRTVSDTQGIKYTARAQYTG